MARCEPGDNGTADTGGVASRTATRRFCLVLPDIRRPSFLDWAGDSDAAAWLLQQP
jgi:hypothetical protein